MELLRLGQPRADDSACKARTCSANSLPLTWSFAQRLELDRQGTLVATQQRHAALKLESLPPCVARIQKARRPDLAPIRHVSVPVNDDIGLHPIEATSERIIGPVRIDDVLYEEFQTAQLNHLEFAQREEGISIAQHGRDRCDLLQLPDDLGRPDIAPVQDVRDSREKSRHLWIEVSVRIGNDADEL